MCVESLLWRDGETSELEHAVCMQSEWSEAVLWGGVVVSVRLCCRGRCRQHQQK